MSPINQPVWPNLTKKMSEHQKSAGFIKTYGSATDFLNQTNFHPALHEQKKKSADKL